jgi:ATP-dependent Lon protease
VKEKVLAAKRAGLKTIILPKRNEPDLDDLSPELRGEMTFILVDNVDEVLQNALETFSVYPPKPTLNGKNGTYPAASNKGKRKKPKATAVTD